MEYWDFFQVGLFDILESLEKVFYGDLVLGIFDNRFYIFGLDNQLLKVFLVFLFFGWKFINLFFLFFLECEEYRLVNGV